MPGSRPDAAQNRQMLSSPLPLPPGERRPADQQARGDGDRWNGRQPAAPAPLANLVSASRRRPPNSREAPGQNEAGAARARPSEEAAGLWSMSSTQAIAAKGGWWKRPPGQQAGRGDGDRGSRNPAAELELLGSSPRTWAMLSWQGPLDDKSDRSRRYPAGALELLLTTSDETMARRELTPLRREAGGRSDRGCASDPATR